MRESKIHSSQILRPKIIAEISPKSVNLHRFKEIFDLFEAKDDSPSIQCILQFLGTGGMFEFAKRLFLDLADALAGDHELLSDLFQCPLAAVLETEAEFQHHFLAGR